MPLTPDTCFQTTRPHRRGRLKSTLSQSKQYNDSKKYSHGSNPESTLTPKPPRKRLKKGCGVLSGATSKACANGLPFWRCLPPVSALWKPCCFNLWAKSWTGSANTRPPPCLPKKAGRGGDGGDDGVFRPLDLPRVQRPPANPARRVPDAPALEFPPSDAGAKPRFLSGRIAGRVSAKVMQTALALRDVVMTVAVHGCVCAGVFHYFRRDSDFVRRLASAALYRLDYRLLPW